MLSSRCDLVCGPPLHSELTAAVWLLHETYTGTGLHCNMCGVWGGVHGAHDEPKVKGSKDGFCRSDGGWEREWG